MMIELAELDIIVHNDDVSAKLHSLRVYYSATRNKHEASRKKSGSGRDDVIKVKWPYYEKLSFLNENLTPRRTTSNLQSNSDERCDSPSSIENATLSGEQKERLRNRIQCSRKF